MQSINRTKREQNKEINYKKHFIINTTWFYSIVGSFFSVKGVNGGLA